MQPNNVKTLLAIGDELDHELFKIAIHYAENGIHTWFISPEAFERAPGNMKPPDKEILKLITFIYLKDYKDLISHLNGIHLWIKLPSLIILSGIDRYCNFNSHNYNAMQAAVVTTSLLDGVAVCALKKCETAFLLVTCSSLTNISKLQPISDHYFSKFLYKDDKFIKNVIRYFE